MSGGNLWTSFCNLIAPCLDFITEFFTSSSSSSVANAIPSVNHYFADLYKRNPPHTVLVLSQHRIVVDELDDGSFHFLEIGNNGDDVMLTPFNPKALSFPRYGLLSITGSSNGLVCLVDSPQPGNEYVSNRDIVYNNQKLYLVNPLSGNFVLLPKVKRWENISNVVYGFGLSLNGGNGEYKILRFVSRYIFPHGMVGHEYKVHGEILTLGGEWRYFEDSTIPFYLFPSGVNLYGILHWIGDDRRSGFIYAFDIGRRIQLPTWLRDDPGNIVLSVYDEKLCFTDNSSEFQVDVWIMIEYGVTESWTRNIILKNSARASLSPCSFIPITTLRNGELLLSRQNEGDLSVTSGPDGQNMISFDPKTNTCRELEVPGREGTVSFLFEYTPSFSSVGNGLVL